MIVGFALDLLGGTPTCIRENDHLACGFHCVSNLETAACAQTPEGLCAATPNQVVCWDPPPDVRELMHARDDLPQPTCVTTINQAACGYDCAQTGDQVGCAATPFGACSTRFDVLRCWDPAPEVRWELEARGQLRRAQCARTLDQVACGYSCIATLKNARCAETPWGRCESSFDTIACWDPQFMASPPAESSSSALAR